MSPHCVCLILRAQTPGSSSRSFEDCGCNGVQSLQAQSASVNLQHLVSWRSAGCSAPCAPPPYSDLSSSSFPLIVAFILFIFSKCTGGNKDHCSPKTMNEEMTKSEEQHLSLQKALQQCELVQNMIDISISSLEGLRTKCATSNDLTQKEIRTLEVRNTLIDFCCASSPSQGCQRLFFYF